MRGLWYFFPLFKAEAFRFGLALMLSIITLAAGAALLGTSGWFITAAALSVAGVSFNIFGPSALVRGFSFVRILARYGERVAGHDATLRLLSNMRGWLFGQLFPLAPLSRSGMRHGDLVSRLVGDVEAVDTVLLVSLSPMIAALVTGLMVTGLVYAFLPAASVIYAICLLVATLGIPRLALTSSRRLGRQSAEASAAMRIATLDAVEGHRDLVAAGEVGWAREKFTIAAHDFSVGKARLGTISIMAVGAVQVLAGLSLLDVLWFGLQSVHQGRLGGPVLVGLLLAVLGSFEATAVMARSVGKLAVAVEATQRLKAMTTQDPPVTDPGVPVALAMGGDVELKHVRFGYTPDRSVIDDLSLGVRAGERIAIIGASGAGKSTLLGLLLRLYDSQAGTIRIAGSDIRTVTQSEVHQRIALLSQDSPVFMDTVRNNLLVGRADASDADLWHGLETARLADHIRSLPSSLDTLVGEAGKTLSAGQARRLCLARTLISNAEIIVLDEPTSGLDLENETAFLADLADACTGRTVILATHASLPTGAVDTVYRFENGRLAAV